MSSHFGLYACLLGTWLHRPFQHRYQVTQATCIDSRDNITQKCNSLLPLLGGAQIIVLFFAFAVLEIFDFYTLSKFRFNFSSLFPPHLERYNSSGSTNSSVAYFVYSHHSSFRVQPSYFSNFSVLYLPYSYNPLNSATSSELGICYHSTSSVLQLPHNFNSISTAHLLL